VDTLDESRLRPEFVQEMERLRHTVIEQCEPKLLLGKTINGAGAIGWGFFIVCFSLV
jgi:hypothetical protein